MGLIQDKMAAGGITPPGAPAAPAAAPSQGTPPQSGVGGVPPGGVDPSGGDIAPIIAAAMTALYEAGAIEDAIGVIENAKFPAQGLADVTYDLLASIDEKAGGNIPEELFAPAASTILGMFVEDCQKLGLNIGGRDIALATQLLMVRLLEEGGQDVSELKASMNEVDYEKVGALIDEQMAQQQGAK